MKIIHQPNSKTKTFQYQKTKEGNGDDPVKGSFSSPRGVAINSLRSQESIKKNTCSMLAQENQKILICKFYARSQKDAQGFQMKRFYG